MKKLILNTVLFFLTIHCFTQTQLLKDYNFNEGGYYMLGVFSTGERNVLRDSLGEFYTDEVEILNQFKKEWIFTEPGKKYTCGYHYKIYICKEGLILEEFVVNLNCNEIVSNQGSFYFETNKLKMFYEKLKMPVKKQKNFLTISEARRYRNEILKNKRLIMTPTPMWTKYEGTIQFKYECPNTSKDCTNENNIESTLTQLRVDIKELHSDEQFELINKGNSLTSIFIEIRCNNSLLEKFKLYKRDTDEYFGKFHRYHLSLTTYWIKK